MDFAVVINDPILIIVIKIENLAISIVLEYFFFLNYKTIIMFN